jgi:hypothetical protein
VAGIPSDPLQEELPHLRDIYIYNDKNFEFHLIHSRAGLNIVELMKYS